MELTVKLNFIKCGPKKMRLAVNLVKGLSIEKAKAQLKYLDKESARFAYQLLKSGVAAAKDKDMDLNNAYIKNFICNQAPTLKRRRICERGKSTVINKRTSHIILTIANSKDNKNNNKVNLPKIRKDNGSKSQSK